MAGLSWHQSMALLWYPRVLKSVVPSVDLLWMPLAWIIEFTCHTQNWWWWNQLLRNRKWDYLYVEFWDNAVLQYSMMMTTKLLVWCDDVSILVAYEISIFHIFQLEHTWLILIWVNKYIEFSVWLRCKCVSLKIIKYSCVMLRLIRQVSKMFHFSLFLYLTPNQNQFRSIEKD